MSQISPLGTDSDGRRHYDVTLTLDQSDSQVRPGMSASAAVVTGQAQGVNVPNAASPAAARWHGRVLKNGKTVSTPVVVGLQGDTRTQIVSGLRAGQQVVVTTTLPSLSSTRPRPASQRDARRDCARGGGGGSAAAGSAGRRRFRRGGGGGG